MKKLVTLLISASMLISSVSYISAETLESAGYVDSVKVSSFKDFVKNVKKTNTESTTESTTQQATETTTKLTTTTTETTTEATTEATTKVAPVVIIEPTTEATTTTPVVTEQTTKPQNVAVVADIAFNPNTNLFGVPQGSYLTDNMKAHIDRLNKNLKTKVVIMIGSIKKPVTAADIASFTDKNTGAIDYNKVWSYCAKIMDTYNTAAYSRKFKTHDGVIVNVPVGDYGWKVDMTGLTQNLYQSLVNFKDTTLTYKPSKTAFAGAQTVYGNDIGGTYIEIDLTNQTVHWFKNGVCVLSDYCVTGKKSTPTPAGTFSLKCNTGRTLLTGPTWKTWVNYWAHFSQGCGLHDATWQSSFGLARWKAGYGSHGCVNLPAGTAKKAHDIMQVGEPVVVYYR